MQGVGHGHNVCVMDIMSVACVHLAVIGRKRELKCWPPASSGSGTHATSVVQIHMSMSEPALKMRTYIHIM